VGKVWSSRDPKVIGEYLDSFQRLRQESDKWLQYEREKRPLREQLESGEITGAEYDAAIKAICERLGI
jgi:hypothetical protein